ncbi:MAG: hypothetical protein KF744_13865 [Taibaiella sp.]|nr:hypothetical protein [Taibaiella sp.]
MKTNKDRDLANSLPTNAKPAQRVAWHKEHATACGCRPLLEGILDTIAAEENTNTKTMPTTWTNWT